MLSYLGVGDLATFMGVTSSSLNQALASLSISSAMASVRSYVDQELTFHQNDSIRLDGTGTTRLRLPERPVRLVTSVTEDDTVLAATDYVLRDSILTRLQNLVWSAVEPANIAIIYSHGWDVGDVDANISDSDFDQLHIPADLVLATLSVARRSYEHSGLVAVGAVKSETIGGYAYTLDDSAVEEGTDLIPAEEHVLDRYRFRGSG